MIISSAFYAIPEDADIECGISDAPPGKTIDKIDDPSLFDVNKCLRNIY